MKKNFIILAGVLLFCTAVCAQQLRYTSVNNSWNADSLGNHRAVVHVGVAARAAHVVIPWRRHDSNPAGKRIIVQDAATGRLVPNIKSGRLDAEAGELWFEPISGAGDYYVYYMPYRNEGRSNYPKGVYLSPLATADAGWLTATQSSVAATVREIQSINAFNSFYPMEVIATAKETRALLAKHVPGGYLVFP